MRKRGLFLVLGLASPFIFIAFALVSQGQWDGKSRFTIVINSRPLSIFSVEPREKKGVLLLIPQNMLLEVPYDYGTYPASSVYKLGELDQKRGGGRLLKRSIEETLGISIDGFISGKSEIVFPSDSKDVFDKIKKNYFSLLFSKELSTDLAFFDLIRLWKTISDVRSDKLKIIDLAKTEVLVSKTAPDGTFYLILDRDLQDLVIGDRFYDQNIRLENLSLEIVNASGKEKLASIFGKILTNLGANVILKSTAKKNEAFSCLVSFPEDKFRESRIISKLRQKYQCQIKKDPSDLLQVDVKVILGEGFIK